MLTTPLSTGCQEVAEENYVKKIAARNLQRHHVKSNPHHINILNVKVGPFTGALLNF